MEKKMDSLSTDRVPVLRIDSSSIYNIAGELTPSPSCDNSLLESSFRSTTGVKLGLKERLRNTPTEADIDHKVVINVGGKRFTTYSSTMQKVPHTRLADLNELDSCFDTNLQEYFFDRNPKYFADILDFYRSGELHFSHCLCGPAIKKELDFWGIEETSISSCCWRAYKQYEDEKETLAMLDKTFNTKVKENDQGGLKTKFWNFLEKPQSSKGAQIWAIFMFFVILLSVAGVALETHPSFRVPKRTNDPLSLSNATQNTTFCGTEKKTIFKTTKPHVALVWLDKFCLFVFGLELILRFLSCPKKSRFLFSFYNISDIFCVVPTLIVFLITLLDEHFWDDKDFFILLVYLSLTSVLRVFRILKMARHYRCLKVLQLAVRSSLRELILLFMLIFMGMLIFSTLIYFAEFEVEDNFENIPIGFWWTIVTMTTVGYGDFVPKSGWGYLVGSICGIFGMLATGLPIPIIASNFSHFYSYERYREKLCIREELKKKATKDLHPEPEKHSACRWSERKGRVSPFVT